MSDTKIEMKIDEEIKPLKELCEKMTEVVKMEVAKGVDRVDTKELGYAIDMIKDLADAKAKTVEACYHKYILGVMEESEEDYGETWDEEGPMMKRGYRGRDARTGRYVSRGYRENMMPEDYRNMDMPYRMGYTENGSNNGNDSLNYTHGYNRGYEDARRENGNMTSKYDMARRSYMDSKRMYGSTDADKQKKAKELEKFFNEMSKDMEELIAGMSAEEKTVWKHKIQKLNDMVQ